MQRPLSLMMKTGDWMDHYDVLYKDITRHKAQAIVWWPNHKRSLMIHIADSMMVTRQIFSLSSKSKWVSYDIILITAIIRKPSVCRFQLNRYIIGWCHGPLTRYVVLWVTHAPGMPGTFSPWPTSKETASWRSRYAWCMSGLLPGSGGENIPGIPGACATHNITYVVRDSCRLFNATPSS